MRAKPIVVFDTNIFLQALGGRAGSPAARCLDYFDQGNIILAISRATLQEIEDVFSRSKIRAKHPLLTDEKISELLDRLVYRGIYVREVPRRFTYPRDPDDEPYLNLALAVDAEFLVSRDKDMLDLMNWHQEEGRAFQKRFRFLQIMKPEEFLAAIEKNDSANTTE